MSRLGPQSRKLLAAAATLALVPYLLLFRLEAAVHRRGTIRNEDVYHTPSPSALPLLSVGYRRALADLLWVQALLYFGDQVAQRGRFQFLLDRTDAILKLDPSFRDVYDWIAVVVVYNSSLITRHDIEMSNRYLQRGIRQFPRDGELRYMLAFNYAMELPVWTEDEQEKRRLRRRAAALFAEAARLPGAPADAAMMAVEMGKRGGDRATAIAYLRRLLDVADDRVRDQLLARLALLTSEQEAEQADAARRELERTWQRDWPYLPRGLFVLVGERPDRVEDEDAEPDGAAAPR